MKRIRALLLILLLTLSMAGCAAEEDPFRMDTVIYIPAEPTTGPTEPPAVTAETEETEAVEKPTISLFDSISGKNKNGSGSNKAPAAASKPSATEPVPETVFPTEPPTSPAETEYQIYDISDYVVGALEKTMMDRVNSHRREAGVAELEKSDRLSAIASVRAYEASLSWSHTRPDGSDYTTVLQDYGFQAGTAGENLLYTSGDEDGAALVGQWMNAESNRDNLLYEGFSTLGIGIYEANGYVYIACLLAG